MDYLFSFQDSFNEKRFLKWFEKFLKPQLVFIFASIMGILYTLIHQWNLLVPIALGYAYWIRNLPLYSCATSAIVVCICAPGVVPDQVILLAVLSAACTLLIWEWRIAALVAFSTIDFDNAVVLVSFMVILSYFLRSLCNVNEPDSIPPVAIENIVSDLYRKQSNVLGAHTQLYTELASEALSYDIVNTQKTVYNAMSTLNDYYRVKNNTYTPQIQKFNISDEIQNLLDDINFSLRNSRATVKLERDPEVPALIEGDKFLLREVICWALLKLARKQARVVIKLNEVNNLGIEIVGLCCDTLMIDDMCVKLGGRSVQHTARSIIIPVKFTEPPPQIAQDLATYELPPLTPLVVEPEEDEFDMDMSIPSDDESVNSPVKLINNLTYLTTKSLLK